MEQATGETEPKKRNRLAELTKAISKKRKALDKKLETVEGEVKKSKAAARSEPIRRTRTVLEEVERQTGEMEAPEPAVEEAVVRKGVIRRRVKKDEAAEAAQAEAAAAEAAAPPPPPVEEPAAADAEADPGLFGDIRREAARSGVELEAAPEAPAESAEAAEAAEAAEQPAAEAEAPVEAAPEAEATPAEQATAEAAQAAAPLVPEIKPEELEAPVDTTEAPVQRGAKGAEPLIKRAGKDATPDHMKGRPITEGKAPAPTPKAPREKKKKKKGVRQLKEVAFSPSPHGRRKRVVPRKQQQKTQITTPKAIKRKIQVDQAITVGDLAKEMGIKAGEIMKKLMGMGVMVTITQSIDADTAGIVAAEFGYEVTNVAFDEEKVLEEQVPEDAPEDLKPRWPVVTVMGHVDHGKTSLLDAIRSTDVASGEAGGITQHIGAYTVTLDDGRIVSFLDTPGHEAFTAMRARGANMTDIVVLVVAADDGVMPQTVEAIEHSKAAGVPIIVAVNKIDKPNADPSQVINKLAEHELVPEDWGGETLFVHTSAIKGDGVSDLLESLLLQAEILELKANPDKAAKGAVVESKIDKGRGPVATVLVQEGTLNIGDVVVAGMTYGKIRALVDDKGNNIKTAGPSTPVEILGLSGVPDAGDTFNVTKNLDAAKDIVEHRELKAREAQIAEKGKVNLDNLFGQIQSGDVKDLNLIVKADVHGSIEAVAGALEKIQSEEVKVKVIRGGVGAVNESDVNLASASQAIIIGFNVRPDNRARELAEKEHIDIRTYSIIYEAVDDIKKAMVGLLAPKFKEVYLGRAEVRQTFHISKTGTIAGCYVNDGKITRNASVRLLREGTIIYDGKLNSLKRFKDDTKEVASGYECGMGIENFNDIKVGDVIEAYKMEQMKAEL